jgi:hypothetical protein
MARYITKLRTSRPRDEVFAYMADLRNFVEWDPGVRQVAQVEGDGGGLGAVFDVTVGTKRPQTLRYRVTVFNPPNELLVVAKTKALTSRDRITVDADETGSIITYEAVLRLNGALRVGGAVLNIVFKRIGDRASAGLCRAIEGERLS